MLACMAPVHTDSMCVNACNCTHTHTDVPGDITGPSLVYLLKQGLGALRSRKAASKIQEAHVMPGPATHLEHLLAVSDGLCVARGCLAAGAHMEAECTNHVTWERVEDIVRTTEPHKLRITRREEARGPDTHRACSHHARCGNKQLGCALGAAAKPQPGTAAAHIGAPGFRSRICVFL